MLKLIKQGSFMKIISIILIHLYLVTSSFSNDTTPTVDCLMLEDENSIICKYTTPRLSTERSITFQWIDPNDNLSRERVMTLPVNHSSVYDFRYINGRLLGEWTFQVIDNTNKYKTNFILQ